MENSSYSNTKFPSILVDIFSLGIIIDLLFYVPSFLLGYWSLLRYQCQLSDDTCEPISEQKSRSYDHDREPIPSPVTVNEEAEDEDYLLGQDVKMVIERLGIDDHSLEGEELLKRWGHDDISGLFEEEPSLEEVREAFDVFDENKDGFIDAGELQRVLCGLGLRQGSDLQACRNMIRVFDENDDGKIDFKEFVRFMLNGM